MPPVSLSNADLERLMDTTDEWIVERTGIRNRQLSHVETTDLAELAARRALAARAARHAARAEAAATRIQSVVRGRQARRQAKPWMVEEKKARARRQAEDLAAAGRREAMRRALEGN